MKPLISVIIPLYNHAHTIERSLRCISKQSYRPLEVVIVDDGSTDNFEEKKRSLIAEAKNSDVTLKIFRQENRGAPSARNHGFSESLGEFVIFWDADTVGKKNMLETMYYALLTHPEASYCYSQFRFGWKKMKSNEFNEVELKKNNFIDTTSLVRRDAVTPFDETLKRFQDWDMWLTMLEQGRKGVFVCSVLYRKIVGFRDGISNWLPSFAYRVFSQSEGVKKYQEAKEIILKKHGLH
jgi:glycosyltransferase involved in cell wall biosynthesis